MRVTIALPLTNGTWINVDALLLFNFAPHLANIATFAIHRDPDRLTGWKVSNLETGFYIARGETRAIALKNATAIAMAKDISDFERAYGKALKVNPLSDEVVP